MNIIKKIRHGIYIRLYGDSLSVRRAKWTEKQLGDIPKGKRILDAGAGECKNKKYCQHLMYVAQDFCEYSPENESMRCASDSDKWDYSNIDIVSDITEIPVENESFDAIICTEVFEHLVNPELAVKEFARILKPGGGANYNSTGNWRKPYDAIYFLDGNFRMVV